MGFANQRGMRPLMLASMLGVMAETVAIASSPGSITIKNEPKLPPEVDIKESRQSRRKRERDRAKRNRL